MNQFERPAATSTDPEKRSCSTANLALRQKKHKLLYWFLPPDSFQVRFETTRILYFVKLKHASRTFFNLKLQRTAFHSKNAPKKCSQSSPRGPKTSPKCLRELPGDVLRGHTHLQSGPGASPIRQSGQSVINSSKVEHPRDALQDPFDSQPLSAPRPPNFIYYYNLHLFSSYFTFCYLRLPYVYRHTAPGVGGFERPAATSADPEKRNCSTAKVALWQTKRALSTGVG